jgi:phosphoribosylamine-glycine ligase
MLQSCLDGKLRDVVAEWKEGLSAVGVVLSAPGYPEAPVKGSLIKGKPFLLNFFKTWVNSQLYITYPNFSLLGLLSKKVPIQIL